MAVGRVVVVSNRLPVTTAIVGDQITLSPASGGLATGLSDWHARSTAVWVGWPGTTARVTASQRAALERELEERRILPVYLTRQDVKEYYDGFSNGVLWPVFHYLPERVPLGPTTAWEGYRRVNERFAERVAEQHRPGDLIWVHDYQLMLVPGMLRQRIPHARVGFFLHIPFPAAEVFRILPWRREILEGLLGADLIGFHTYSYMQHFASALADLAGVEPEDRHVWIDEREARLGVFPMGIDPEAFSVLASSPAVQEQLETIRRDAGDRAILLSVDRLDYTKGIRHRLRAFEVLLHENPDLRERIRLIQVAVPSRDAVPSYQEFRREIEGLNGRINGTYGTVTSVPIHYLHQSVTKEHLAALYRAADVMLVTPLRDGMNLVAKEYIASRIQDDGVLVLSEFAGAAEELHEAVFVNAYDVRDLVAKFREALGLSEQDRSVRMRAMRRRVIWHDVHRWANEFIQALERPPAPEVRTTPESVLTDVIGQARATTPLAVLLDYDGTLVPIARTPEQAAPDHALRTLLASLAKRPSTIVQIVSGRPRESLEEWFGRLPITLWAEHGIWVRPFENAGWQPILEIGDCGSLADVRSIMGAFVAATPGSFVEEKAASLAWHYRQAARSYGAAQARELRVVLSKAMADRPVEILEGKKAIEVRPRGAGQALIVQWLFAHEPAPALIVAFGDDRTDETMFAALPPGSVTVHVGGGASLAAYRVRDWKATRSFLSTLLS
jgi:trehalose 6-phosphate synthase/phosphatase